MPDGTWIEPEAFAYPHGGFTRFAYVTLRGNEYAPKATEQIRARIGTRRRVAISVPDTYFSIPARLRLDGKTIKGFVSVVGDDRGYSFTPEAEG